MDFDEDAVESWSSLCTEERIMREAGASDDQLNSMRLRIIVGMVNLLYMLSEEEKASLILVFMSGNFGQGTRPLPSSMSNDEIALLSSLLRQPQGHVESEELTDPTEHNENEANVTISEDVCED